MSHVTEIISVNITLLIAFIFIFFYEIILLDLYILVKNINKKIMRE